MLLEVGARVGLPLDLDRLDRRELRQRVDDLRERRRRAARQRARPQPLRPRLETGSSIPSGIAVESSSPVFLALVGPARSSSSAAVATASVVLDLARNRPDLAVAQPSRRGGAVSAGRSSWRCPSTTTRHRRRSPHRGVLPRREAVRASRPQSRCAARVGNDLGDPPSEIGVVEPDLQAEPRAVSSSSPWKRSIVSQRARATSRTS